MKTEIRTINKYTLDVIMNEWNRSRLNQGMLFVSLGHDDYYGYVRLDQVAGKVTRVIEKDGQLICDWEPLKTPFGKIARKITKRVEKGIYVRPIGTGTVKDGVVQDDYRISHFALEVDPVTK